MMMIFSTFFWEYLHLYNNRRTGNQISDMISFTILIKLTELHIHYILLIEIMKNCRSQKKKMKANFKKKKKKGKKMENLLGVLQNIYD